MGKITVKHYPNTNLKPITDKGRVKYPLYVQVIFNRKIYKFKSEDDHFKYVDELDLKHEFIQDILMTEIKRVERCVKLLANHNDKLLTSKDIYKYSIPLNIIIEKNFGKLIEIEFLDAPLTMTNLSFSEIKSLIYFLNGYDKIYESEKVNNVLMIIDNLDYPSFAFYEKDYCAIDFYFGEKFNEICENIIFSFGGKKTDLIKPLENFRYFINL